MAKLYINRNKFYANFNKDELGRIQSIYRRSREDQDGQEVFYLFNFFLLLKTRTKKIIASSRRSRTVDSGEVISEVEALIQCIH